MLKAKRMSQLKKRADEYWSRCIRTRDSGKCRIGGCSYLCNVPHPHHVFGRKNLATRWDMENGLLLCFLHHRKAHDDPESIRDKIVEAMGEERFSRMREKSRTIVTDLSEESLSVIVDELKEFIKHGGG
jgi:hypothetical protein